MKHGFETTFCCNSVSVDSPPWRLSTVNAILGRPIPVITNAMNSRLAYSGTWQLMRRRRDGWIPQSKWVWSGELTGERQYSIGKSGIRWRTNRKLPASQVPGSPNDPPAIALRSAAVLGVAWGAALTPTETWSRFDRSSNTAVRQTSLIHSLKTSFALPHLGTPSGRGRLRASKT